MNGGPNDHGYAKVFIIKTEYGYAASPSPVVVPSGDATLDFENLSDVTATVSIPGKNRFTLRPNGKSKSVRLPARTERVILYRVGMANGLFALGHSAPTIIRDP